MRPPATQPPEGGMKKVAQIGIVGQARGRVSGHTVSVLICVVST
ncbi:hypothetical protein FM101_02915 [Arthrobacter rhombi]|uniref:Uncharacterized protein n=1 Tax=Arthrobacter rhombi TaxID=71253 RepID=A0A1R4FA43_9MICC|nr:hypothetical protein FM101_02915 [Arthrobacter rhombi]